jgi:hypothetical protein
MVIGPFSSRPPSRRRGTLLDSLKMDSRNSWLLFSLVLPTSGQTAKRPPFGLAASPLSKLGLFITGLPSLLRIQVLKTLSYYISICTSHPSLPRKSSEAPLSVPLFDLYSTIYHPRSCNLPNRGEPIPTFPLHPAATSLRKHRFFEHPYILSIYDFGNSKASASWPRAHVAQFDSG